MVNTVQEAVTEDWTQVSNGDCTIQSSLPSIMYEVAVSVEQPTNAFITLSLAEATTFAYKTPVWLRLKDRGVVGLGRTVNIIK